MIVDIKKIFKLSTILFSLIVFLFLFTSFVKAQTTTNSLNLNFKDLKTTQVNVNEGFVPGDLQIFWHDLKDTIDLALTFNKQKKIKKELKFAEKRIRWASNLGDDLSQEDKEKAFKFSAKADEYFSSLTDDGGFLLNSINEKELAIVEDIITHQENKIELWQKLEPFIDIENIEDFARIKSQVEEKQQNFMKNIANNDNLSTQLKNRARKHVEKMKQIKDNRELFIQENGEQIDNLKRTNNQGLKDFLEKRRQNMEDLNQDFQKEFETMPGKKKGQKEDINNNTSNDNVNNNESNNESANDDESESASNNNEAEEIDNKINTNNNKKNLKVDINSDLYKEFLRLIDSSVKPDSELDGEEVDLENN